MITVNTTLGELALEMGKLGVEFYSVDRIWVGGGPIAVRLVTREGIITGIGIGDAEAINDAVEKLRKRQGEILAASSKETP